MRDGLLDTLNDGGNVPSNRLYGFSSFSLETLGPLLGHLHAQLDICNGIFNFLPSIFDVATRYTIYSVQFSICILVCGLVIKLRVKLYPGIKSMLSVPSPT